MHKSSPSIKVDLGERTSPQKNAILAQGPILVSAGAGSGKTSTLTDKCLHWIAAGTPISEILIVTFTEAATAEMRRRLRNGLEKLHLENPHNSFIEEQVALFDTAYISTIHSFCYNLVRESFHLLGLDPRVGVLDTAREAKVRMEAMNELFEVCYEEDHPHHQSFYNLLFGIFEGDEEKLRKLLLKIHDFAMGQPSAEGWFKQQQQFFSTPSAANWKSLRDCKYEGWVSSFYQAARKNQKLEKYLKLNNHSSAAEKANAIADAIKQGRCATEFKKWTKEKDYWDSVITNGEIDPLDEDWEKCRQTMLCLIEFAKAYQEQLLADKKRLGQVGFDDLQQMTLQVLTGNSEECRKVQNYWRSQFRMIVVDEYQDVNPAQDTIIQALKHNESTVLLVGDVKQSIYGFRGATPELFQGYLLENNWKRFDLNENFRSHEKVLDFINRIFSVVMTCGTAGVDYQAKACLAVGKPQTRQDWTRKADPAARVEFHLLVDHEEKDPDSFDKVEREALVIGNRLLELRRNFKSVSGKEISWEDVAILLRSPKGKYERFARVFQKLNIPLAVSGETFEQSTEVLDLLSLMRVLDNFQQDIPLAAVMRSPFGLFKTAELATMRAKAQDMHCPFWQVVLSTVQNKKVSPELRSKTSDFLLRYESWRKLSRVLSVSQVLEKILAECGYWNWLECLSRPVARKQNVQRFLGIVEEYEREDGRGIGSFLRYWQLQEDLEIDRRPPKSAVPVVAAVQMLSIHGSKGLEFPIVVLADCAKSFNHKDSTELFITSDKTEPLLESQLCGHVFTKESSYPSIAHFIAARSQRQSMVREELRLLYVALTRAKEMLIISGYAGKREKAKWIEHYESFPEGVLEKSAYLKWLLPIAIHDGLNLEQDNGSTTNFSWQCHHHLELEEKPEAMVTPPSGDMDPILKRLELSYPFATSTTEPAKRSASQLQGVDEEMTDAETRDGIDFLFRFTQKEGAAEIGSATHRVLETVGIDCCADPKKIKKHIDNLVERKILEKGVAEEIDIQAIARFWQSEVGAELIKQAELLKRELPFTCRMSAKALQALVGEEERMVLEKIAESEFIIVQGVVDLAMIGSDEIWILDFKTDRGGGQEANLQHYRNQLKAYAMALISIYKRPVTRQWVHFLATGQTVLLGNR